MDNKKLISSIENKDSLKNNKVSINSKRNKRKSAYNAWCIKITVITICLAAFCSFISELTSSVTSVVATIFLLLFLIILSIIFDGVAMAVTSADKDDFLAFMKEKHSINTKIGLKLIDNQERVANICADVIGDIFSIVSGSCSVAIVIELIRVFPSLHEELFTIIISSIVAGITVGGKAFMKKIAIKSCNSYLLLTTKIIALFIRRKNVTGKDKRPERLETTKGRKSP